MTTFERVLQEHAIDMVLVVGDVNSTIACALVASKLGVPIAHVDAGVATVAADVRIVFPVHPRTRPA